MRPGTSIRQQEYDWTWGTDYAGSCLQGAGVDHSEVRDLCRRKTRVVHHVSSQRRCVDPMSCSAKDVKRFPEYKDNF